MDSMRLAGQRLLIYCNILGKFLIKQGSAHLSDVILK